MVLGSSWEEGWRRGRRAGFILGVPVGAALVLVTLALASCSGSDSGGIYITSGDPLPAGWTSLGRVAGVPFYRFRDEERGVTCYLKAWSESAPVCFPDSQLLPASVEAR